VQFPGREQFCC